MWWSWTGLNRRPPACKADALPAELQPPFFARSFLSSPLAALPCQNKKSQEKRGHSFVPATHAGTRTDKKNPAQKALYVEHIPHTALSQQFSKNTHRTSNAMERKNTAHHAGSSQVNSESGVLCKGGDPAAGSPTATLLRLHPNHRPYRRRLPHCCWLTGFG